MRPIRSTLGRLAGAGAIAVLLAHGQAQAAATTVREPAWGLPHIYADTDLELARENGREIAKDRIGQMILLVRAGRGTLAQAFGLLDSSFIAVDLETRLTGYTSSEFQTMFESLPAADQAYLLEYCKGVNDTIQAMYAGIIPKAVEITVLQSALLNLGSDIFGNATNISDQVDPHFLAPGMDPERPQGGFQFTPEMALSIAVIQVRNFGLNTFEEANRLGELLALEGVNPAAGEELWRDLNFLVDPLAPVSVPNATSPGYGGPLSALSPELGEIAEAASRWKGRDWSEVATKIRDRASHREETLKRWSAWPKLGSYAWIIASDRSETGNPWVGGFPQTGIQTPSLMHYVENRTGEGISGNGMEFVGAPYVLIGHTDHVAFTTTTAQLRIIDTFFEEIVLENADAVRYSDEGSPAAMSKRQETLKIGGSPNRTPTFWRTHERGGNGGTRAVLDFIGDAEGTAESGSATTLVDNQGSFDGTYVGGYVLITDGTGSGQIRAISGASATTLTVGSAFTTAPAAGSVYVAAKSAMDLIAVAADSGAWMEESTTAWAFSKFQRANSVMDMREAVRLIPSTHNFFAADNQAFNGVGTDAGFGNIGYWSSGYSRKRQDASDKLLPLDGAVANPLTVASGTLTGATGTTVSDTGAFMSLDLSPEAINYRYDNPGDQGSEFVVSIISGTGAKQTRRIASNTDDTITVEFAWGQTPAPGDHYEVYEIVAIPEAVNPSEGYIGNWNNKASVSDDGDNFGREHRATFILERLAANTSWNRADQRQLNKDLAGLDGRGVLGRQLVPRLREAVDANCNTMALDALVDTLEAHNAAPNFGRHLNDPVTATTRAGEVAFLNTLINQLASDIYADELAGAVSVPTGTRALAKVIHAIDSASGTPAGAYAQAYSGDYFNGSDWKDLVCTRLAALEPGGIPADTARPNDSFDHPLSVFAPDELEFQPIPQGNRGTWEQIVEVGGTITGEFIFPLGQSGQIRATLSGLDMNVQEIDPNFTSFQPVWRDWRFLPMLHVSEDLAGGSADADNDGVFDGFERWYFGDTSVKGSENSDGDRSKLSLEFQRGTDPTDPDTDDDGIVDGSDGLDQDRLGTGFATLKGLIKAGSKGLVKLTGKFGTGDFEFDPAADTITVSVTTHDEEEYYSATIPAGTLTGTAPKFSFKDKTGAIDLIKTLILKVGKNPTSPSLFKLGTIKHAPSVELDTQDLRVTVTIHDDSADADRVILDERTWEAKGISLKSTKTGNVPVYN